ncbi:MAG: hypothetical protein ACXAEX_19065 [Promethearchaeota archaeon]
MVLTLFTQSYNNDISIEHPGSFPNLSTNNIGRVIDFLGEGLHWYLATGCESLV